MTLPEAAGSRRTSHWAVISDVSRIVLNEPVLVFHQAPDIHTIALLIVAQSHFVTDFAAVAVNYALSILNGRRNASNVPVVVVNNAA